MIAQRLEELRLEYARGEQRARQLRQEQQTLRDTMLRIAGAIQVLEELQTQKTAQTNGQAAAGMVAEAVAEAVTGAVPEVGA